MDVGDDARLASAAANATGDAPAGARRSQGRWRLRDRRLAAARHAGAARSTCRGVRSSRLVLGGRARAHRALPPSAALALGCVHRRQLLVLAALAWQGRGSPPRLPGARGGSRSGVLVGARLRRSRSGSCTLPFGLACRTGGAAATGSRSRATARGSATRPSAGRELASSWRRGRRRARARAPARPPLVDSAGGALALLGVVYVLLQPLVVEPLSQPLRAAARPCARRRDRAARRRVGVHRGRGSTWRDASRSARRRANAVIGARPDAHGSRSTTRCSTDGSRRTRSRVVAAHELAHVARAPRLEGRGLVRAARACPVAWRASPRRSAAARGPRSSRSRCSSRSPCSLAVLPVANALSRRYEAEADWLALVATRDPAAARGARPRASRRDDPRADRPEPDRSWARTRCSARIPRRWLASAVG